MEEIDNMQIFDDYVVVKVEPKVFSKEVVFMAAYVMLSNAHVFITGDPNKELRVNLRPFKTYKGSLKDLGYEFNDQLLNYSVYEAQSKNTADLRKILLASALLSNGADSDDYDDEEYDEENYDDKTCEVKPSVETDEVEKVKKIIEDTSNIDPSEDPDKVTIPWYNLNKDETNEFFKAVKETLGKDALK